MLVNTVNAQAMKLKQRPVPFRVTFGQVIIDRNQVNAASAEGIQKSGQGRDQRFAFAGGHFGNLTRVEHHAANQLHVVVDHVPFNGVARRIPGVGPIGFVALNAHVFAGAGNFDVKIGEGYFEFGVFGEASGGFFHHGKRLGQNGQQHPLQFFVALFVQHVYLVENGLFLVNVHARRVGYLLAEVGNLLVNGLEFLGNVGT